MSSFVFRQVVAQLNSSYLRNTSCIALRQLSAVRPLKSDLLIPNEWQNWRSISTSQEISLFSTKLRHSFVEQKRYKKDKQKGKPSARQEESDEESDEDEEQEPQEDLDLIDCKAVGFVDKTAGLMSLRLDSVLNKAFNMGRHKAEEAFYNNMVRLNGQRVAKKAHTVDENDEIDLILGLNNENNNNVDVSRVVIKKIKDKVTTKDRIVVKLRVFKLLTIENYPKALHDGQSVYLAK